MRAFIYMLDALFAVTVATLLLSAIIAMYSSRADASTALHKTAQEALLVMDKNGTLKGLFSQSDAQARASMNASINELLPSGMAGRANATLCVGDDDEDFGDFNCNRNIVAANGANQSIPTGSARRLFVDAAGMKYGYAVLEVWYR